MIEAAKHKPETKRIAMDLQAEQMAEWKLAEIDPGLVFDMFRLNVVDQLSQPAFNIWLRYAREYNPGGGITTLLETLKHRYTDADLSRLLIAAKQDEFTFDLALDLQIALANLWLVRRVRPEYVFEWLGLHRLHRGVRNLYKNVEVRTWKEYAKGFRHETELGHMELIDLLRHYYKDKKLSSLVVKAHHKSPQYDWTVRLMHDLVVRWIGEGKSVAYVREKVGVAGVFKYDRMLLELANGSPVELKL
uniref:RxLR effector candidate protein n=2 Tax=Hyaloperonospora arabidopsidis (strain Emoy2) TaxID=559515 RepID=M4B8T2_HYAAE